MAAAGRVGCRDGQSGKCAREDRFRRLEDDGWGAYLTFEPYLWDFLGRSCRMFIMVYRRSWIEEAFVATECSGAWARFSKFLDFFPHYLLRKSTLRLELAGHHGRRQVGG